MAGSDTRRSEHDTFHGPVREDRNTGTGSAWQDTWRVPTIFAFAVLRNSRLWMLTGVAILVKQKMGGSENLRVVRHLKGVSHDASPNPANHHAKHTFRFFLR